MRTADVEALLSSFEFPQPGIVSELGIRADAAYLKLTSKADQTDYAVVWTPGDRWFSLDVAGGYSYDYFEEDTPDSEAADRIAQLVDAAVAYIDGRGSVTSSRLLRVPVIHIETDDGHFELRLSTFDAVKRALRIRKPRSRNQIER